MTNIIEIDGKEYIVIPVEELEEKLHDSYVAGAFNQMVKISDLARQ